MIGRYRRLLRAGCGKLGRGLVMGALSGFAGSGGGLRGAALRAPLTAPRPAP